MITFINLNNYRKCRLWLNETIDLPLIKSEHMIENFVPSSMKKATGINQIALELSLPRNSSYYALVGFECRASNNNQGNTKVTVLMSKEKSNYSSETLSDSYDKVFMGISEEYGQSVLDSAVETINEIGGLPFEEINFNVGAHAECGSSKVIFAQVTRILIKLCQADLLNMTEAEIKVSVKDVRT
jgi:hypothetical protein